MYVAVVEDASVRYIAVAEDLHDAKQSIREYYRERIRRSIRNQGIDDPEFARAEELLSNNVSLAGSVQGARLAVTLFGESVRFINVGKMFGSTTWDAEENADDVVEEWSEGNYAE